MYMVIKRIELFYKADSPSFFERIQQFKQKVYVTLLKNDFTINENIPGLQKTLIRVYGFLKIKTVDFSWTIWP